MAPLTGPIIEQPMVIQSKGLCASPTQSPILLCTASPCIQMRACHNAATDLFAKAVTPRDALCSQCIVPAAYFLHTFSAAVSLNTLDASSLANRFFCTSFVSSPAMSDLASQSKAVEAMSSVSLQLITQVTCAANVMNRLLPYKQMHRLAVKPFAALVSS